jgi:hypothetical protein
LQHAAGAIARAKTLGDLSGASADLARALQAVGVDRWPRFVADAADRARALPPLVMAQAVLPLPLLAPPPAIGAPAADDAVARLVGELKAAIALAKRRLGEVGTEVRAGKLGEAAGHLLLGRPYPGWVDDPGLNILHTEGTEEGEGGKPEEEPSDIDVAVAKAEAQFGKRVEGLVEKHVSAAEGDIRGKPVMDPKSGKEYDHLTEVQEQLKGLENDIKTLSKAIKHSESCVKPRPENGLEEARQLRNAMIERRDSVRARIPRGALMGKGTGT